MEKKTSVFTQVVLCLFVLGATVAIYEYRKPLGVDVKQVWKMIDPTPPCTRPLTFSIGQFDSEFNIDKSKFIEDIDQAGSIWDTSINRNLFKFDPNGNGDITINAIYDYRQSATDKMQVINNSIDQTTGTYSQIQARYNLLLSSHNQQKANLDSLTQQYNTDLQKYNSDVNYWNSRGGAPKDQFATLESERNQLNSESATLKQTIADFNSSVDEINTLATKLNSLGHEVNQKTDQYNSEIAKTGSEFDEGEYVEDSTGPHINIYQFKDKTKLIRVLAHELGHALGMNHVANSESIMYEINKGTDLKATSEDITELKAECKIK